MNTSTNASKTAGEAPNGRATADLALLPLPSPKNRQNRQNRPSGSMQRAKGNRAEVEFCHALSAHLGETIQRQLGAARDGGPDVVFGHWAIEVKRQEILHLPAWWRQACRQAAEVDLWPALATRVSRQPWRVIVALDVIRLGVHTARSADLDQTAMLSLVGFATLVAAMPQPPGLESADE